MGIPTPSLRVRLKLISTHRFDLMAISKYSLIRKEDWEKIGGSYPKPDDTARGTRIFQFKRRHARHLLGKERLLQDTGVDLDLLIVEQTT